jgi:hypothetical protein
MVKVGERSGRTQRRFKKTEKEYYDLLRKRDYARYNSGEWSPEKEEILQKLRVRNRKYDRKNFLEGPIAIQDEANQLRRDMRRANKVIKRQEGWLKGEVKSKTLDNILMRRASASFSKHNISGSTGGGGVVSAEEYEAIKAKQA